MLSRMNSAGDTLKDRLQEVFGAESGHAVAARLTLSGTPVSGQAVYKWLRGAANISDELLAAVCREYGVSEAWLKFGQGPKHPITDSDRALLDLMHELPESQRQMALDFIGYQLTHATPPIASEKLGRYMVFLDRVKDDMTTKRKGPKS